MNLPQLDLIKKQSPEDLIRENLGNAMIRYRGNIQAYYTELLKKLPSGTRDVESENLQRLATLRLRAHR